MRRLLASDVLEEEVEGQPLAVLADLEPPP